MILSATLFQKISYNKIFISVFILILTYMVAKIISTILKKASEKYSHKRIQITGFIPVIKLILYVSTSLFVVFGLLGISQGALTALGLSLGVAMGFAFQDIIGNFFGGIIIIFFKPFTVGDKIKIGDSYGEVTDISIRRFTLVTLDDSLITVPNKSILTEKVSNANSGELNCQVVTEIHLPYNIDFIRAEEIGYEAVYASPYSYLKKPIAIHFNTEFNYKPCVKMKVKAYVFDHRYESAFASDITRKVRTALVKESLIDKTFYSNDHQIENENVLSAKN